MSETGCDTTLIQLTLFVVETPAPSIPAPEAMAPQSTPILPDTSLPWSDDYALGGWSARMFLHQLWSTSTPHWQLSDTERLLSGWTAQRLRGSPDRETSLSDAIKPPGKACASCFRTARMVQALIRRALARGRSLRLLLRTEHDTIPVIVTFGSKREDCESWTLKSAKPLPDSLAAGLLDFLKQHAPSSAETP